LPDHVPWPAWRRPLVDGWFPIFPWLGIALSGALAGRLDLFGDRLRAWLAPVGAAAMGLGALAWAWHPPELTTRGGYSELFYPATPQYCALALGAVLLALALLERATRRYTLTWLSLLGRSSLMLYVAHVALIAFVLDEWFRGQALPEYLLMYGLLLASLGAVAYLTERRRRSKTLLAPGS
jgi:hypothetical protein